ncbi:hypothetical protein ACFVHB_20080 [Kitasatospora sp. NPDC127111]|uniref:hypothetical protein n=1 Tax=Kitasatospora sp. NPDC127111 TaxID=3345363 RepID=UPI003635A2B3
MSPEIVIAFISAAGVVVAATVPAVLGLRRARGAAEAEGAATRESVSVLGASLAERIDAVRDELRSDVAEIRESVTDVRAWQAGHDAEHLLIRGAED